MIRSKAQLVKKHRVPVEGLFCNYTHRTCMQSRLEGYDYCLKHILEDKNSPYKQCSFMASKTGKRCPNAAPKIDRKDEYCQEHARKAAFLRQRATRKRRPKETPETLLEELDRYSAPAGEGVVEIRKTRHNTDSLASRIIDYASSSESDVEPPLVDQAWRGEGESDAESIDSEQDDPLKHAGIYTAEEVALILRDKLIRLQSLYIDQFKRLQHVMKECRRKYLHIYKQEQETLGSIYAYKSNLEQRDKYSKLLAMKRYHRRFGKEALLHRQSKQRRIAVTEGANHKPSTYQKCIFTENNIKCNSRVMPLSKYCSGHILHDIHQVLYHPCEFAGGMCGQPISAVTNKVLCPLHSKLTDQVSRIPVKPEPKVEPKTEETKEEHKAVAIMASQQSIQPTTDMAPPQPQQPKPQQILISHQKLQPLIKHVSAADSMPKTD